MSGSDQFLNLPDGRQICFRLAGPDEAETLILVVGLGLQLTYWPAPLFDGLVRAGLRVLTLDNRDAGRSFHTDHRPPSMLQQMFRRPTAGYDLVQMAGDVLALMDGLSLRTAHLMGMSMGGMIAQTLAARHPERVRSLVSLFSTTGSLRVGQPGIRAMLQLMRAEPTGQEAAAQSHVDMMRLIGSRLEWDEARHRQYALQAWSRGGGLRTQAGTARQIGAIINSGDRTAELRRIRCPTLVVHGDTDRMVATSGGHATVAAIPGARMVVLPGMGHDVPLALVDVLVSLVAGHAGASQRQGGPRAAR